MGSRGMLVHEMLTDSFLQVSLEQLVQSIFLRRAHHLCQTLNIDSALRVVLDLDGLGGLL